jgi:hypothetical protein
LIVLAYHGCDIHAARDLLSGSAFELSNKSYDWLGTGAYFWEDDIVRAYQWARERRPSAPCVVGAVIELGNCLDLTKQSGIRAVKAAHRTFMVMQATSQAPVPQNEAPSRTNTQDRVLRKLDRAVIDHLHRVYRESSSKDGGKTKEFDTVRALFPEGEAIYEGAGFWEKTHVQIAVRKPEQVLGVFRVPVHQRLAMKLPDFYSGL